MATVKRTSEARRRAVRDRPKPQNPNGLTPKLPIGPLCPNHLGQQWYLDNIPMWRHGLLPVPFIYWLEYGRPNLKYIPVPWMDMLYSFEHGIWYFHTL